MRAIVMLGVVCAWVPATASAALPMSGREVFEHLHALSGTWTTTTNGRRIDVNFRATAAGSVVVETWTLGSGRESMTLYALDGERLLATHYCPQGNQPRLAYVGVDEQGRAQFRFVDGGNLHEAGRSHQQAFWLTFDGDDAFSRGETYVENGAPQDASVTDGEPVRYTRGPD